LFVPRVALATTIVGIWTPKKITIAADSRATLSNAGVYTGSQTVCKIQEAHGLVFALSGLPLMRE
jgi:ATP-dependent protease HslVU (ClpYQ) peptidase subunit